MKANLKILLPFLIVLLGLLAYLNSFSGMFMLDDMTWIVNNSDITSVEKYLYHSTRPLTALSFALNYAISRETATDYHAINLIIHLLAGLLLYGVVRRTLELPLFRNGYDKYSNLIAFFSTTLWVIHPLQTESVTYIIQRGESLMGFFYLATLYCAVRGFASGKSKSWFVCSIIVCALGMTAKPIMVTAPLLVLLYDYVFISKSWRAALRSNLLLYIGLLLTWIILAFLVLMPNESSGTTGLSIKEITPLGYLATQQGVIVHYIKLIFWPQTLCFDYAWPAAITVQGMVFPALFIAFLVVMTVVLVLKKRSAGFCLAWFFVILAPTSSIVPIADYAVEHRVYLSLAGITVLFTVSVVMAIEKLSSRFKLQRKSGVIASALLMIIVVLLMLRTVARNRDYSSSVVLTRKTVAASPYNFRARSILINSYMDEYKFAEAENEARKALVVIEKLLDEEVDSSRLVMAANPYVHYPDMNFQVGSALLCQNKNDEAIHFFMRALALDPKLVIARYNLAVALHGVGRDDDSLREVLNVIETDANFTQSYFLAGMLLHKDGRYKEAINYFNKAIELGDVNIIAKMELAWLLASVDDENGRDEKRALSLALEVCEISGGGNYRALDVLAAAYAANGDFVSAEKTAEKALALAELVEKNSPETFANVNIEVSSSPDNIRKRLELYRVGKNFSITN